MAQEEVPVFGPGDAWVRMTWYVVFASRDIWEGSDPTTGQLTPEQVREYCDLSLINTTMDTQVLSRKTNVFTNPPNYAFAFHRLRKTLRDPSKQPIVLVACGSFSPVTYLHLRMFEMAKDYVRQNTNFEIVGGYLSPVSDQYNKPGLLSAHHR